MAGQASNKNRKYGRNNRPGKQNIRYKAERRRERNKQKKLVRHCKKHPNDAQSLKFL